MKNLSKYTIEQLIESLQCDDILIDNINEGFFSNLWYHLKNMFKKAAKNVKTWWDDEDEDDGEYNDYDDDYDSYDDGDEDNNTKSKKNKKVKIDQSIIKAMNVSTKDSKSTIRNLYEYAKKSKLFRGYIALCEATKHKYVTPDNHFILIMYKGDILGYIMYTLEDEDIYDELTGKYELPEKSGLIIAMEYPNEVKETMVADASKKIFKLLMSKNHLSNLYWAFNVGLQQTYIDKTKVAAEDLGFITLKDCDNMIAKFKEY